MTSPPPSESTILFRPSKKRKIYRQRETSPSPSPALATQNLSTASPIPAEQSLDELITSASASSPLKDEGVEGTEVPISEIVRLRKLRRPRVGGVEFRADSSQGVRGGEMLGERQSEGGGNEGTDIVAAGPARRFAPKTGTVLDVDRHMTAYIDSELAKRRAEGLSNPNQTMSPMMAVSAQQAREWDKERRGDAEVPRQPAALGKLLEIDLGDEARSRNVERTEKAKRRLDGEEVEEEIESKKGKVRLGPDGKPLRGRKRRGSDDVKRDKLVEDILRENRLEIYDEPIIEAQAVNDDQAADDRIAEAFRKEFMDAVSQKQRKKAAPAQQSNKTGAGKKEEDVLKGPRLGGSRSARAAMRETMLKNAKK